MQFSKTMMFNHARQAGKKISARLTAWLFCGLLVSFASSSALSAPAKNPDKITTTETFTPNWRDTDIRVVIEAVSKYTGLNFLVDDRVKGKKVTFYTQRAMDAKEIYQVFLSVLKVHNFAAVPGDNVIKIVPDGEAKTEAINTITNARGGVGDELVTHVIEVRYVQATQLVPILRPLASQRGHFAAVPNSNVIIISDSASNIARLKKIIRRIDQASGDEIEVIPLEHASASELVRILKQLDSANPKAPSRSAKVIADVRTNSLLISGDKSARLRMKALVMHLDTPLDVGGNTHVVYLRNAVAKDLVPVLTGIGQNVAKGKKGAAATASDIIIQADENTNALVITAPPDVYRSLKTVISQLDVRRAQVMVEAVIAEVSTEVARELGVQWAIDGRDGNSAVGLVNFSLGTPITAYANLDAPPNPIGFNVGVGDLTGTNKVAALLSALAGDSFTNILSTPTLVTLDNEEAEIVVGQNVPFVTGQFTNTGSTTPSNPFQTIQRQDVGLTLKIKPQINEGDAIKLDVTQEVSSLAASAQAADIVTNKRSIRTSVMVDDGQMIVLGGLIEDNLIETEQKVPGLGDIPILGWLFRYQKTTKIKTNLMVFLHPIIMKDSKTMLSLTSEKYNYLRAQQLDRREKGVRLLDEEDSPLLPEMEEFLALPPPYEESAQRMELSNPSGALAAPPPSDSVPLVIESDLSQPANEEALDTPPAVEESDGGSISQ